MCPLIPVQLSVTLEQEGTAARLENHPWAPLKLEPMVTVTLSHGNSKHGNSNHG